jgi:hypothetical protein
MLVLEAVGFTTVTVASMKLGYTIIIIISRKFQRPCGSTIALRTCRSISCLQHFGVPRILRGYEYPAASPANSKPVVPGGDQPSDPIP